LSSRIRVETGASNPARPSASASSRAAEPPPEGQVPSTIRPSPTATAALSAVRVQVCRMQPAITSGKSAASTSSLSTSFWRLATSTSRATESSAPAAAAVSLERMQKTTGPSPIRSAAASIPQTAGTRCSKARPLAGSSIRTPRS
jgi:hypothetical protein